MIAQEQDIDIKQELKRIKKRVKQLEAQRELETKIKIQGGVR